MYGNWFTLFLLCLLIFPIACQQEKADNSTPNTTATTSTTSIDAKKMLDPAKRFGALFEEVQMTQVFPDGKTFVDCTPKMLTDAILANYEKEKTKADFDLKTFVLAHFDLPKKYATDFQSDSTRTAAQHINSLWDVLTREPDASDAGSLIPLPKSYIVPGGRFGEVYYWDSYFTMLGLQTAGKTEMIENMADNFAYLIDTIGFIPNGNRTYYLGRSQPPFFAAIIQLLAENGDEKAVYKKYLSALEGEYAFWMDGASGVVDGKPYRRVVRMSDGSLLNRYWDDNEGPRPESYREDVETAEASGRDKAEVYKHLRAGAESGWDYTSRWFADGKNIATIETTHIIPADLNSLLYNLEMALATAYEKTGDKRRLEDAIKRARDRKKAMNTYLWDEQLGLFMDYHFIKKELTKRLSLASVYPLYFNIASKEQAQSTAIMIDKNFTQLGGVLTTPYQTGQQWDAPNGWAPLQWLTIKGLQNYGFDAQAAQIRANWVAINEKVYRNTGKMVEKYNVLDMGLEAGGGEYPVQDGFGWTNGVLLRLLDDK